METENKTGENKGEFLKTGVLREEFVYNVPVGS